MIPMALALVQGGLTAAGGGLQLFGGALANSAFRRQARLQVRQLESNAETVGSRTGFEMGRVQDQVSAAIARQDNYWSSGNIDASTGSPAILAAQSEALGLQDQMLLAAKGQQERADIYGQISAIWNKADDMNRATSLNALSTILNTASKLAGIAGGQATPGASAAPMAAGASPSPWSLY